MIVKLGNLKKAALVLAAAGTIGTAGIGAVSIANAQGPVGGPSAAVAMFPPTICSTTNYTDVAAKALGMQSPALRQALVSGKTLEQIATSQNVAIQTVRDALRTAFQGDLDQALKDGLITQQMYDAMKDRLSRTPNTAPSASGQNATPPATQNAPLGNVPQGNAPQGNNPQGNGPRAGRGLGPRFGNGFGFGRFLAVPRYNQVNQFIVAAKALNMSCADMVKAMQGGQSIAQVAASKNVQAQTVIDALISAEKAAITQDVQEGLLGQAEADGRLAQVTNRAGAFVYSTGHHGPFGRGLPFPGGHPGNMPGMPGANGNAPQPPAQGDNPDTGSSSS